MYYLTIGTVLASLWIIAYIGLWIWAIVEIAIIYINDLNWDNLIQSKAFHLMNPMYPINRMSDFEDLFIGKGMVGLGIWSFSLFIWKFVWPLPLIAGSIYGTLYYLRWKKRMIREFDTDNNNDFQPKKTFVKVECLECLDIITVMRGDNNVCSCGNVYVDPILNVLNLRKHGQSRILKQG